MSQQSHDILALPRFVAVFRRLFAQWCGGDEAIDVGCPLKHLWSNADRAQGLGDQNCDLSWWQRLARAQFAGGWCDLDQSDGVLPAPSGKSQEEGLAPNLALEPSPLGTRPLAELAMRYA